MTMEIIIMVIMIKKSENTEFCFTTKKSIHKT